MLYINLLFRSDMHANENNWAENPTSKGKEQHDARGTC